MSEYKNFFKRYSTINPVGKRIHDLDISRSSLLNFKKASHLNDAEIKIVEDNWNGRFALSKYLYGYSILALLLITVSWFLKLSLAQFFAVSGFMILLIGGGISAMLNKEKIDEMDRLFLWVVSVTKISIQYHICKNFLLSDKSTKSAQLEYIFYNNQLLTFALLLLLALLSRFGIDDGLIQMFVAKLSNYTLLSFDGGTGWNIYHMNAYIVMCIFTYALNLEDEKSLIETGNYKLFIKRSNIWNLIIFIAYSLFCYHIISGLEGFKFSSPDYNKVLSYWPIFVLGIQNLTFVILHEIYTMRMKNNGKSVFIYWLLLFILSPYILVSVIGLQLLPGLFVILLSYILLVLIKFLKETLKVNSIFRAIAWIIAIIISGFKVYQVF